MDSSSGVVFKYNIKTNANIGRNEKHVKNYSLIHKRERYVYEKRVSSKFKRESDFSLANQSANELATACWSNAVKKIGREREREDRIKGPVYNWEHREDPLEPLAVAL